MRLAAPAFVTNAHIPTVRLPPSPMAMPLGTGTAGLRRRPHGRQLWPHRVCRPVDLFGISSLHRAVGEMHVGACAVSCVARRRWEPHLARLPRPSCPCARKPPLVPPSPMSARVARCTAAFEIGCFPSFAVRVSRVRLQLRGPGSFRHRQADRRRSGCDRRFPCPALSQVQHRRTWHSSLTRPCELAHKRPRAECATLPRVDRTSTAFSLALDGHITLFLFSSAARFPHTRSLPPNPPRCLFDVSLHSALSSLVFVITLSFLLSLLFSFFPGTFHSVCSLRCLSPRGTCLAFPIASVVPLRAAACPLAASGRFPHFLEVPLESRRAESSRVDLQALPTQRHARRFPKRQVILFFYRSVAPCHSALLLLRRCQRLSQATSSCLGCRPIGRGRDPRHTRAAHTSPPTPTLRRLFSPRPSADVWTRTSSPSREPTASSVCHFAGAISLHTSSRYGACASIVVLSRPSPVGHCLCSLRSCVRMPFPLRRTRFFPFSFSGELSARDVCALTTEFSLLSSAMIRSFPLLLRLQHPPDLSCISVPSTRPPPSPPPGRCTRRGRARSQALWTLGASAFGLRFSAWSRPRSLQLPFGTRSLSSKTPSVVRLPASLSFPPQPCCPFLRSLLFCFFVAAPRRRSTQPVSALLCSALLFFSARSAPCAIDRPSGGAPTAILQVLFLAIVWPFPAWRPLECYFAAYHRHGHRSVFARRSGRSAIVFSSFALPPLSSAPLFSYFTPLFLFTDFSERIAPAERLVMPLVFILDSRRDARSQPGLPSAQPVACSTLLATSSSSPLLFFLRVPGAPCAFVCVVGVYYMPASLSCPVVD